MTDASGPDRQNRLAAETSPYLLQHAANPVDWYPWGPEALAAARASGRPILLSIGYSACHWCHVMAHECFEDAATAAVMNALFINIKVDREERPDLDRIYQLSHQLLTRRGGGWPLTMFLTHDDQRPFFGGTYFPPVARQGLPAFAELLGRVAAYYREQQPELRAQNQALVAALERIDDGAADITTTLDATPLEAARSQLEARFDGRHGGWGDAPKFPQAGSIQRLLRGWHATALTPAPDLKALYMAAFTLQHMADGGLRDQLGGGFFRYSVDAAWQLPHFEKMLSDNGALLEVYAQAALATGDEAFATVAADTAQFLIRELQSPAGGFHAALDADSDGHEGSFYLWTREEAGAVLDPADAALCAARYGLDGPANCGGRWHPVAARSLESLATDPAFGPTDPALLAARVMALTRRLRVARDARVHPGRDHKILAGWNAIAIRGLAVASRVLAREDLEIAASRALGFLREALWLGGRLKAFWTAGVVRQDASLDDHALLIDAILALQALRFRADELAWAQALADQMLERFVDTARGGFYFTADDQEPLIHRSRSFADDATPSGNAVAVQVLLRLGTLLGEERYLRAAEATLRAAWPRLQEQPLAHMALLTALEEQLRSPVCVVLRGEPDRLRQWTQQLDRLYAPRVSVHAIPVDAADLPPALAAKTPSGPCVGYLCTTAGCSAPLTSLPRLLAALRSA